jgi:hypothetical protein
VHACVRARVRGCQGVCVACCWPMKRLPIDTAEPVRLHEGISCLPSMSASIAGCVRVCFICQACLSEALWLCASVRAANGTVLYHAWQCRVSEGVCAAIRAVCDWNVPAMLLTITRPWPLWHGSLLRAWARRDRQDGARPAVCASGGCGGL